MNFKNTLMLIFVLIIISFLISYSHYALVIATLTALFIFAIFLSKREFLLYYFLLVGALYVPSRLIGKALYIAGPSYLQVLGYCLVFFLYTLALLARGNRFTKSENSFFLITLLWISYTGFTILWAESWIDSMRYYPKLMLALFVSIPVLLEPKLDTNKTLQLLKKGAIIYILVSVLAHFFLRGWSWSSFQYFQGFSGRFLTKYFLSYIIILFFSIWMIKGNNKNLGIALVPVILLIFIVQRSTLGALILGLSLVVLLTPKRKEFAKKVGILRPIFLSILVVTLFYILFFSERYINYMFYPRYGPRDFFTYISQGDISSAMKMVDFKGRLEYWALFRNISFFGIGYGSSPIVLRRAFGLYNELHSDVLQYLAETGIIGFCFYIIFWVNTFLLGWKNRSDRDELIRIFSLIIIGYCACLFFNSFLDHVIDYQTSLPYLLITVSLLFKRKRELKGDFL